eukprot:PhM_4_TR409/c3_g3_i3/m.76015
MGSRSHLPNVEPDDSHLYRLVLWYVGRGRKKKGILSAAVPNLEPPPPHPFSRVHVSSGSDSNSSSSFSSSSRSTSPQNEDEIIISPHVFVEMVHFGYAFGFSIIVGVTLLLQLAKTVGLMPVKGSKERLYANVFVSLAIVISCVWAICIYVSTRRRQLSQKKTEETNTPTHNNVIWLRYALVWASFIDIFLIDWSFSGQWAANMMTVCLVPLCVCFGMFKQIAVLSTIFVVYTGFRAYELSWGTPERPTLYSNGGDASTSQNFVFVWGIIIDGITYFFTIWSISVMITALGYEWRQMKMSLSVLCRASEEAQEMRFEQAKVFLDFERELTSPFPKHILWRHRQMCDLLISVRSFLPASVGHELLNLNREQTSVRNINKKKGVMLVEDGGTSSVFIGPHAVCLPPLNPLSLISNDKDNNINNKNINSIKSPIRCTVVETETVSSVILMCEIVAGNDSDDDVSPFSSLASTCSNSIVDLGLALDSAARILADYGGVVFGYSNGILLAGFYNTGASHVLAVRAAMTLQHYLSTQHELVTYIGIDSGCVLRGVVGQEGVRMFSELRGNPVNRAAFLCNMARHLGASDGVFVPKRIAEDLAKEAGGDMLVRTVCSYAQDTICPSVASIRTGKFPTDAAVGGIPAPCPRGRCVVCQVFDLIPQNVPSRELSAMREYVSQYNLAIEKFTSLGSVSGALAYLSVVVSAYRNDEVSKRVLVSIQRAFPK